MKFSELNLHDNLLKGIADAGFKECMPVQEMTFEHTLKGKDVTVQSQTGSGKTAAFLITIFQHFLTDDGPIKQKKALIIAPTRELAVQIEKEARMLAKHLDFHIGSFYGGVGYSNQERMIQQGVDVIIGTPGRLLDLSHKRLLDFKKVGILVIDEADRLFDMGFLPDIRKMFRRMLPYQHRQTMLFSATLDVNTRRLAREDMNRPVKIEIEPEQMTVDTISQVLYHVAKKEKIRLLVGLMKKEMPRSCLIFTNMKHTAVNVARHLDHNGFKCQYLIGDLPQKKRLKIIGEFKEGKIPYLVASDVASRGLHVDDLELIVNYDLPEDSESYVHRIGRTARAGKSGKAISLACEDTVYNLPSIEEFIDMKIPVEYAEDDLYHDIKTPLMEAPGRGRTRDKSRSRSGGAARGRSRSRSGRSGPRQRPAREEATAEKPRRRRPTRDKAERPQEAGAEKTGGKRPESGQKPAKAAAAKSSAAKERPVEKKGAAQKQAAAPAARGGRQKDRDGRQKNREGRQTDRERRPEKAADTRKKRPPRPQREGKKDSMEERLEYYRKKYGDNFQSSSSQPDRPPRPVKKEKKGLFKKISSVFSKK